MSEQELKSHIQKVHAELERAHTMTTHERDLLGSLMEDIVINAAGDSKKVEVLNSELDRQATSFETNHPRIAGLIRQIMDTLGKMGI